MTITATWNDSPTSPGYDISISGLATPLNANPFFETNASNWSVVGGTFVQSPTQFHEGTKSGLLTPDGVTANVFVTTEHVTGALPFVKYTFSAWIRCAVSRAIDVHVEFYNSSDVFISNTGVAVNVTANTWTFVTVTASSPALTARVDGRLRMTGTPAGSNTLFVDEGKVVLDYSYYTVTRQDLSGFLPDADVRKSGANPDGLIAVSGSDTAAVSDYEFSFNTNIRYLLRKYNSSKSLVTSENVVVGFPPIPTTAYYGHAWLKDIFTPSNSQPIVVGEFNSYSRAGRVTTVDVLGNTFPVPITDVMSGKTGSFTFYVVDPKFGGSIPTYDQYNTLFNDGQILYFQSLNPQTVGWKDTYLVVNSVEFERLSLAYAPAEAIFKYTIGFTEVRRPATTSVDVSLQTWQMVLDNHTDWQDVLSSHTNWLDVYQDPQDLN